MRNDKIKEEKNNGVRSDSPISLCMLDLHSGDYLGCCHRNYLYVVFASQLICKK